MAADASVFFALWLQKPLHIAAANPNGGRFTDAIATQVNLARPGPVLELGARTGSLTCGLNSCRLPARAHYCPRTRAQSAKILRRKLPGVTVIEGDATRIRPASGYPHATAFYRRLQSADQMDFVCTARGGGPALPRSPWPQRPVCTSAQGLPLVIGSGSVRNHRLRSGESLVQYVAHSDPVLLGCPPIVG